MDTVFDALDVEATSLKFTFESPYGEVGANGVVVIACHSEGNIYIAYC